MIVVHLKENNHLRVVVVFNCGVFQVFFVFGPCTIYLLRTTPIISPQTANVNNFLMLFWVKNTTELFNVYAAGGYSEAIVP